MESLRTTQGAQTCPARAQQLVTFDGALFGEPPSKRLAVCAPCPHRTPTFGAHTHRGLIQGTQRSFRDTALRVIKFRIYGSGIDVLRAGADVRFTPKSGHWNSASECPLCANSGLMHCNKKALHSITLSALASTISGTEIPRALAVLRLMFSSYLFGRSTGKSAALSPLSNLST